MLAVLIDDDPLSTMLLEEALRPLSECRAIPFGTAREGLAFVTANAAEIGIVVTDFDMPELTGLDVITRIRCMPALEALPIVMLTSLDQRRLRREALAAGATDFLTKPGDPVEVRARVDNLLKLRRLHLAEQDRAEWLEREVAAAVRTIEEREREIVTLLMKAAEHRDTDTGDHIARVSGFVTLLAEAMGFDRASVRQLSLASTMHDVGKIAVPDSILLKPGPLTDGERAVMQTHAERGRRILENSSSVTLRLAAEIAATHHEHWDGNGYPRGLSGAEIPLSGRIVAVADVFDALTSERPYKTAWSFGDARDFVVRQAGRQFDPAVVEAFRSRWEDILALVGRLGNPRRTDAVALSDRAVGQ